jgi:ATP-dependent DNA ligase
MYGKALEIKPMKAWKLSKGKEHMRKEVCSSGKYLGQIKKDGYHYIFEKDMDGNCWLFSRKVSDVTGHLVEKMANVPHIKKALDILPNGTIIAGEIYYPGKTSKDVTKIMGCNPDKAIQRQLQGGLIHFYMFDMLQYDGELMLDKEYGDRLDTLEYVYQMLYLWKFKFLELAITFYDDLDSVIDNALAAGEEGVVLKRLDGKYYPDKKPAWEWIKFKIENEVDVICIGFEPPAMIYTGKEIDTWEYWETPTAGLYRHVAGSNDYTIDYLMSHRYKPVTKPYYNGWIGAILMGVYKDGKLTDIGTVSSGLTEADLEAIKADPESFIGKPFKINYMQAYDGAVRHPVFDMWRDDLNEEDCTWEKIFD